MTTPEYEPKTPKAKADMAALGALTRHMSFRQLTEYCAQSGDTGTYKQRVRIARRVVSSVGEVCVFHCVGVGCVKLLTVEWHKPKKIKCGCGTVYSLRLGEKPGEKLTVAKKPNGVRGAPELWLTS